MVFVFPAFRAIFGSPASFDVARATDRVIEIRGTEVAAQATATIIAIRTTAEAGFMQATLLADRINQQGTAQAQIRRTTSLRPQKMGVAIVIGLPVAAMAFFGVRLFNALILRVRIIRDPAGHAIIFTERDKQGRQTLLLPNRAPGPVTLRNVFLLMSLSSHTLIR